VALLNINRLHEETAKLSVMAERASHPGRLSSIDSENRVWESFERERQRGEEFGEVG
jgi:hypothetical protein